VHDRSNVVAESDAAMTAIAATAGTLRVDLQEVIARHAFTLDANRPDAVAKRHALGLRTARENIADLCDTGSFVEYGALAIAAQRGRRELDDLLRNTPADGMVTGIGSINRALFGDERSRAVVMAYDATVLAGTQGMRNHAKTDRMLGIALQSRLPVVLFAEGGGGRPGDTDAPVVAGLHVTTFVDMGTAWDNPHNRWDPQQQRFASDGGFGIATSEDDLRLYVARDLSDPDAPFVWSLRLRRPF
jgi:acetyl-CoA carboxylase carboxyltransferase component